MIQFYRVSTYNRQDGTWTIERETMRKDIAANVANDARAAGLITSLRYVVEFNGRERSSAVRI